MSPPKKNGDHAYLAYQGSHFIKLLQIVIYINVSAKKNGDHAYFAYQEKEVTMLTTNRNHV